MGPVRVWDCLRKLMLWVILRAMRLLSPTVDGIMRRIAKSPGLPVPNPTQSYWLTPPSPISQHSAANVRVPDYADVVIIGSGMTGTSFARTIMDYSRNLGGKLPNVVMLEAREACSGATGRNGGHITPNLYSEYGDLKKEHGPELAKKIICFRSSHLQELLGLAKEEELLDTSHCREVETFDVFHDSILYQTANSQLALYMNDFPKESTAYKIHDDIESIQNLQLSPKTKGCLSTRGGAVHPYRLVTGVLSRLMDAYPSSFHLHTQTPCTSISSLSASIPFYQVITSKGTIRSPHIVHATNGWVSHLLPGMRGKIIPARATMSAQVPWDGFGKGPVEEFIVGPQKPERAPWTGTRSFVFYRGTNMFMFDYLTQLPSEPKFAVGGSMYPPPDGELMFGGHFMSDLTSIGSADDSEWNATVGDHLSRALDEYFEGGTNSKAEVRSVWSGVLGLSIDKMPWVGRIPEKIAGRNAPSTLTMTDQSPVARLAKPGEWMAAGYTGEGMVHAWLSGKALAHMVLDLDKSSEREGEDDVKLEWFPDVYRVSEERWKKTGIEERLEDLMALY